MYYGLGTMETIVRLVRPYKVLQKSNPTILRRYDIVRLDFFLYIKQRFTNIDLWTTLLLARFLLIKIILDPIRTMKIRNSLGAVTRSVCSVKFRNYKIRLHVFTWLVQEKGGLDLPGFGGVFRAWVSRLSLLSSRCV